MAAYKGPDVFRSLRSIALAKGTVPAGFDGNVIPDGGPPDPSYPKPYVDPGEAAAMPESAAVRGPDPAGTSFFKGGK